MIAQHTVSVADFLRNMSRLFRRAASGARVDVTKHGKRYATVLPTELAEEALDALALVRGIREAQAQSERALGEPAVRQAA